MRVATWQKAVAKVSGTDGQDGKTLTVDPDYCDPPSIASSYCDTASRAVPYNTMAKS